MKSILGILLISILAIANNNIELCNNGDKVACSNQALDLSVEKKYDESMIYSKKACDLGVGISCTQLAIYKSSKNEDKVVVEKILRKACNLKDRMGCFYLGRLLISNDKKEEGIKSIKNSCSMGFPTACSYSGVFYLKTDLPKAFKFLNLGCIGKDKKACKLISIIKEASKNRLQKECDNNIAISCFKMGQIILHKEKLNKKDTNKALSFMKKACDLGDKVSCYVHKKIINTENYKSL